MKYFIAISDLAFVVAGLELAFCFQNSTKTRQEINTNH